MAAINPLSWEGFLQKNRDSGKTGWQLLEEFTNPDPILDQMKDQAMVLPTWQGLDPKLTGRPDIAFQDLMPEFQGRLDNVNLNRDALNMLRGRAFSEGPSTWAQMMLEKEGVERGARMDENSALANTAQGRAFSALASRGGASAGSRERIAKQMARDMMMGRQNVNRQGQLDRLGILSSDDDKKVSLAQAIQGMELGAAGLDLNKANAWGNMANSNATRRQNLDLSNRDYATGIDQTNLSNQIAERDKKAAFDFSRWKENMAAWSADRTAAAQEKAGKK